MGVLICPRLSSDKLAYYIALSYTLRMLKIAIQRTPMKTLRRADAPTRKRLMAAIEALAEAPDAPNLDAKPLTGRPGYRLRVGDWRVIYTIEGDTLTVLDIGPRGDIYKR